MYPIFTNDMNHFLQITAVTNLRWIANDIYQIILDLSPENVDSTYY